jgi:uncharacterized membrane protein YcaP (DUF421 family)
METQELLMTALRAVAVYVLMLVVIRLMGKRAVGNFSAFDLLVALMLGEIVDEIIYGDVTFLQGVIPIIVIALLHEANAWLSYSGHGLDRLLEGTPSIVVKDGELERQGMRDERMNEHDVMAQLRVHGIDDLREIKLAMVENDGHLSAIRQEWAEPIQKADLGGEAAKQKEAATSGEEEPPPQKRLDSPSAIGGKDEQG